MRGDFGQVEKQIDPDAEISGLDDARALVGQSAQFGFVVRSQGRSADHDRKTFGSRHFRIADHIAGAEINNDIGIVQQRCEFRRDLDSEGFDACHAACVDPEEFGTGILGCSGELQVVRGCNVGYQMPAHASGRSCNDDPDHDFPFRIWLEFNIKIRLRTVGSDITIHER